MSATIDRLEDRRLFDGNLSVVRTNGVTRLIAEAGESIDVRIEGVNSNGRSIRIVGLGSTTVDGGAAKLVRLGNDRLVMDFTRADGVATHVVGLNFRRGVTWTSTGGQLLVERCTMPALNAGDAGDAELSIVNVNNTIVSGDVGLRFVNGGSDVTVEDANVGGRLLLDGGGGEANVRLSNLTARGEAKLATGAARDTFTIENSRFVQALRLSAGAGDDAMLFDRVELRGRFAVNDGAGRDAIETRLAYNFQDGPLGWTAGFADYAGAELEDPISRWGFIEPNDGFTRGWTLGSTNRSDDIVMYLTRPVGRREGVAAGLDYVLDYDVRFASDAPGGGIGAGGSPGDSVVLKVGGAGVRPATSGEKNRLNLDVGEQFESGTNATNAGTIANGLDAEDEPAYVDIDRSAVHEYAVRGDADGTLHLFVGTDSGYEGRTVVRYRGVDVTLRAVL